MTLHFAPGDANGPLAAHHSARWKNHDIIAYGSGNNLILYTVTETRPSIQTVYLHADLSSVSINGANGLVAVSCGQLLLVFRPVNEYMSVPKWTEALRLELDGDVNCLKWAPLENELAVGSNVLQLYHIVYEYGVLSHKLRWEKSQPVPVEALDITSDGSKLAVYNYARFDSFVKVWMRLSYGDQTTLFDLVYAEHDSAQSLIFFQWRHKQVLEKNVPAEALAAMRHIKNFASFMPQLSEDENDVLYTVTSDFVLHIWATCDFNGHSYLKHWSSCDLRAKLEDELVSFLILDGDMAKIVENSTKLDEKSDMSCSQDSDYLLVIGKSTSRLVRISRVTANPPNSITYDEICAFPTNRICIPSYRLSDARWDEKTLETSIKNGSDQNTQDELSTRSREVDRFIRGHFPVSCTDTSSIQNEPKSITFLVHDRMKSTLRSVALELSDKKCLTLKEKFQGHGKSVRKLYKSSSSHEGNVMLSSSNFPDHNYIWEPFTLEKRGDPVLAITKRFRLNVIRDKSANMHEQGIENAVILNDISPTKGYFRHHLAVIYEKGGFLSLWDCDGATMDDKEASLVLRTETMATHDSRLAPQAFFSKSINSSCFAIVAIYDPSRVEAWKIDIGQEKITCVKITAKPLSDKCTSFTKIAAVETFLEKDITFVDEKGLLKTMSAEYDLHEKAISWNEISSIHTNIERASLVHGASLVGKVAIVNEQGNKLTIWDSKTGVLEYEESFPAEYGSVRDLDWTFLGSIGSAANTLLAVGFSRFVLLYTQLRYDYTNKVATFAALKKIDVSDYSSHEIGDSIWLDDSYLVISSGNQFFIDDKWVHFGAHSDALGNSSINSTIRQLLVGYKNDEAKYPVADLVRILNGPLPVYHPQFLIQALLMDQTDLVEAVFVKLLRVLRADSDISWNLDLPMVDLMTLKESKKSHKHVMLDTVFSDKADIFDIFNPSVADLLSEKLTSISLPLLTRHQQTTLRNLVILVNKLAPFRNSLDANGLKFMYGFELFQASHKQKKLTIRDVNWAVHSDQKEMLFAAIENHYHRLTWNSVKEVGLAYWVDVHRLRTTMESAARNEFADERDPSGRVSVLYLAIKKKQVLLGLWRTVFHPEKDKVVKFLSNNFAEPRWQSAALKNAFVLLGKHRYMDAAYFFLLAGKVKDCCMTLCSKMQEYDLALAVARANSDTDAVGTVLEQFILPEALVTGDRWTTSWAFWEMKLKEISIQALVMSPIDVVTQNSDHFSPSFMKEIGKLEIRTKSKSFLRVDPVLGILYQKLRSSKQRYLEGAMDVSPEIEFDFVLRLATIYSRMGCDYLSLVLLRNWQFLNYSQAEKKMEPETPKDLFSEFAGAAKQQKLAPEPSTFVEPDMSAFSFGF
ncbi:hypothetical protein OXX69_004116 [Metschnikowia pulcherrima]